MIASMLEARIGMAAALMPASGPPPAPHTSEPHSLQAEVLALLAQWSSFTEPAFTELEAEPALICTRCGCCPPMPHPGKCPQCGAGRESLVPFA